MASVESDLVDRREQIMNSVDKALNAAWPERKGPAYEREMERAASDLDRVFGEMQNCNAAYIEQSRCLRYLGSVYADLAPARGGSMLAKANECYEHAEALLRKHHDVFEQAKLDFNIANTLRQLDPNNAVQLKEAERRFLSARSVFESKAPQ